MSTYLIHYVVHLSNTLVIHVTSLYIYTKEFKPQSQTYNFSILWIASFHPVENGFTEMSKSK